MNRPDFLDSYKFNWETMDIIAGGKSSLDAKNYLEYFKEEGAALEFLRGYGFDITDPVQNAELFGIFQEAIQFIKRYFLKEGNPEGMDLKIPNSFYSLTDVSDLLLIATGSNTNIKITIEDMLWAGIILKVMHTILHADKDLRYRYFSTIQTQIFDRFYRFIHRDEKDQLFLVSDDRKTQIPLVEFETKAKKTRESIIIKLLHKQENVAEELFDRIGVRFVTKSKIDALRVMKFLYNNYIIMVNNIKPSRSQNSLINLEKFREGHFLLMKECIKNELSEEDFSQRLEDLANKTTMSSHVNIHSSEDYKAIHFTCRQLIKYRNPFLKQFSEIKEIAKKESDSELAQKILTIDTSSIARDIRFFYPYEVQITDEKSHKENTEGEASHLEYKKSQLLSAMKRLFKPLIDFKELN